MHTYFETVSIFKNDGKVLKYWRACEMVLKPGMLSALRTPHAICIPHLAIPRVKDTRYAVPRTLQSFEPLG